ncbi:MAG TPA: glycosyltransferase [Vicinamibacterales bacterium]|jgi:glycosyltransferase involved in cell wall biosynthesis
MQPPTLVLVVPCYQEAARLRAPAFLDFSASHPNVSLLFVDDGSTDETWAALQRIVSVAPDRIAAIRLESNRGKAEAVRVGTIEAIARRPTLVGFWDADLATPLDAVDDFLAVTATRPDIEIVLGSRVMLMGRTIARTTLRHYLGRVFATAASLSLDLPVYDTQCGAKVFRATDAVAGLFATPFKSTWTFDVELLARYLNTPAEDGRPIRQARIYELTLRTWHDIPRSKLRLADGVRSMIELMAIWRARRAGRAA